METGGEKDEVKNIRHRIKKGENASIRAREGCEGESNTRPRSKYPPVPFFIKIKATYMRYWVT